MWFVALALALCALVLVIVPPDVWVQFRSLSFPTQAVAALWFLLLLGGAVGGLAFGVRLGRPIVRMIVMMVGDTREALRLDRAERERHMDAAQKRLSLRAWFLTKWCFPTKW